MDITLTTTPQLELLRDEVRSWLEDELPLAEATEAFLRAKVRRTLEMAAGSQTEAARLLGLPQSNLSRLMKRLRLR